MGADCQDRLNLLFLNRVPVAFQKIMVAKLIDKYIEIILKVLVVGSTKETGLNGVWPKPFTGDQSVDLIRAFLRSYKNRKPFWLSISPDEKVS